MLIYQIDPAHFLTRAREIGVARAAVEFGVSTRTGSRIVRSIRARGEDAALRRGRPPLPATEEARTVRRFVQTPFPYPVALNQEQIAAEFKRLTQIAVFLDAGNVIRPKSHVGLRLCYPFFPNRYTATSGRLPSAVDAWQDERLLKRAVRLQLTYGDPTTPERVLRAITLQCRTPTVFRPAVAKFICERYAGPGQVVWDPCAGYGGRLLGAAAAGVRYIGTDVDAETVEGNQRLAKAIGFDARVFCCPAEDFTPPDRVALVFTSPPYFNRERYSHAADQSWRKHGASFDSWLNGFLRPVVERAAASLPAGGRLALNAADLRTRAEVLPIAAKAIEIAATVGFDCAEMLWVPLASINRRTSAEPILVFTRR